MKNKIVSSIILLLICVSAMAYYKPSESARLSIITVDPGNDIYSKFGHSAIRLVDDVKDIDVVFDYGSFSYGDMIPFIINFLKGETFYMLDMRSFSLTCHVYEYEQRGIYEQILNLNQSEKVRICDFLIKNIQPENQIYLYNFFTDNCSTRLRDIFETQLDSISWNEIYTPTTWREVLCRYIGESSWISFGIHTGLGIPTDDTASTRQLMFLPDILSLACETATIHDGRNLCSPRTEILQSKKIESSPWWNNASLCLWIVAIAFILITIWEFHYKKRLFIPDYILFFLLGILGCFIWIISFISIHSLVFPNCNTIWLTPLHLLFALLWLIPQIRKWTRWYFVFAAIMAVTFFLVAAILGQYIPQASWPILIILISRASGIIAYDNR